MDVDARMRALDPADEWRPNAQRAWIQLQERERRSIAGRRRWTWAAATAATLCIGLFALPGPRATAQRLWDQLFLGRIDVVRVDFDNLPDGMESFRASFRGPGSPQAARDAAEASRLAGFMPRLPGAAVLDGRPALSVIGAIRAEVRVRRDEIQAAVQKAGITGINVPNEWDGARLTVDVSPMITAEYPDISLIQCRPFTMTTPPGFDIGRFAEIAFRLLGVSSREARYLSRRFVENPALLLGIGQEEERVDIREVEIAAGRAILIEDFAENGESERVALIWNTQDRIFLLSGKMTRELAIAVANSIP